MFTIPQNGSREINLDNQTIKITRLAFNSFQFRIYEDGEYTGLILFNNNAWTLTTGQIISKSVRDYLESNLKFPIR